MNTGTNSYSEVIFRGSKAFFGARNNLDIMIVEHPKFNCLEIIAYKSSSSTEAPRLYVSKSMVANAINKEDYQTYLEQKKLKFQKERKVMDHDVLSKLVWNTFVTRFILEHIEQVSCSSLVLLSGCYCHALSIVRFLCGVDDSFVLSWASTPHML